MEKMQLNIDPSSLDKLKEHFEPYLVNLNKDNAFFHAVRNNTRIIAYSDGKIYINGNGSKAIYNDIEFILNNKFYDAIGITCEGLDDIFGPLVICSASIKESDIENLHKLNLTLGKKLSDYQITKIAPYLLKIADNQILVIDPKSYNAMLDKNYKTDQILAHYAYELISKLHKRNTSLMIVDSFIDSANFFSYNQNKRSQLPDFAFYDEATSDHYSAYVSQIIARYAFLQKMNEYSTLSGTFLIKGRASFAHEQYDLLLETKPDIIGKISKRNLL